MKIPKDLRWEPTGRTLGQGGQSHVHLVIDKEAEDSASFALKALSNTASDQAYQRFYREIEIIKRLDHPGIIKIFDHSQPDSPFHYYVMEYHQGAVPLDKVLFSPGSPYKGDPGASLLLFLQLCEAINVWEKLGDNIVHRDLSPKNILRLPDGSIKVIDFGICQIGGDGPLTLVDEGVGTQNYMAPECESGSDERIGIGADLYSAGKILWSAITGQRAFAREKPAFIGKSMPEMFPHDHLAWHLFHIFEKTIRNNVKDRWASAEQAKDTSLLALSLVLDRYPPLEKIYSRCPMCGVGDLAPFEGSRTVFGNPPPRGIQGMQCTYCGVCLAINHHRIRDAIASRQQLD